MIDWLRAASETPVVEIAGRALPIAIRRHARAQRLTMRLAPDGSEIRVTLPRWGRTRDALVFAEARSAWIAAQLARIPVAEPVLAGSRIRFRGHELTVDWNEKARRLPRQEGDRLYLGGPQAGIGGRVQRWLETQAIELMRTDLAEYCERALLSAPELRLSRAQRRWGSCSGSGPNARCIRINWRLVQAPDAVRRSVVAHEVAHLTHFDHSPAFHAHLARLFEGEIADADRWLKEHGRSLYAPFG